MRRTVFAVVVALLVVPAWASNPGELQDCSDWIQLQPGYTCTTFVAPPCDGTNVCEKSAVNQLLDNSGRLLWVRDVPIAELCYQSDNAHRAEIVAHDGTSETVLGMFTDRCDGPTRLDFFRLNESTLQFDRQRGALLVRANAGCDDTDTSCLNSDSQASIIAIEGFATTFDILQTFTPTAETLGFRPTRMEARAWLRELQDSSLGAHGVDARLITPERNTP